MSAYDEGKATGLQGLPQSACPHRNGSMDHSFWMAGWDVGDRDRRSPKVITSARQQGKTLALARKRVRAVAQGATINGTYKLLPEASLEAFRADLIRILAG